MRGQTKEKEMRVEQLVTMYVCMTVVSFVVYLMLSPNERVIEIDNYEHAIIVCTDSPVDDSDYVMSNLYGRAYIYERQGYLLMVNPGHEYDDELIEVVEIAERMCNND